MAKSYLDGMMKAEQPVCINRGQFISWVVSFEMELMEHNPPAVRVSLKFYGYGANVPAPPFVRRAFQNY